MFFTVLSDGEAHIAALALVMHVGMNEWERKEMEGRWVVKAAFNGTKSDHVSSRLGRFSLDLHVAEREA